ATPPVQWSETTNIRWKIAIPGKGLSTPVVWQDKVFITTAINLNKTADKGDGRQADHPMWMRAAGMSKTTENIQQFMVMAIDRNNGKILWQKAVHEQLPHEGTHKDGSWASASCVTDGEVLIAPFGSFGFYALAMDGNLLWQKDLGDMNITNRFGEGSSPALFGDRVIINWDHEGESFIMALDKHTGESLWKTERDEGTSWSTPLVVPVDGRYQVIVPATNQTAGYDLETGELIWYVSGLTRNVIPSPVHHEGVVYVMSGFRGAALQAIRLSGARGDLQGTSHILWTLDDNTPYTPSPLLYQGNLYYLRSNNEQLTCTDASSGKELYSREKLDELDGVYASPVAADGRIYITGRNGVTAVLQPGAEFKVLAINPLDDKIDASAALVGKDLILRGLEHLYCIRSE
ncbi:PQQ-binding-like beta-propeller repeat protein, partial [candidate division KSB1 bacterium]|nr:PQQ-binding-like beta-propeller repeat protein [candidate division KSB1 bacterium]